MPTPQTYHQLTGEQTLEQLQSDLHRGLTQDQIQDKIKTYGFNILQQTDQESMAHKLFRQFQDTVLIILISNAIIAYRIEDYRTAIVLICIVCINALISFAQEYHAEKTMQHLKNMVKSQTTLIREGQTIEIDSSQLVPGDIVTIQEGMTIPADLRVLTENALSTNDFALTGESNPVRKYYHAIDIDTIASERNNILYMGTTVATGNGIGIVIATGMNTLIGHIAKLSQETSTESSPLQCELKHLSTILTIATLIIRGILIVIAWGSNMGWYQSFLFALGVASSLMPQGLPSQINVALSNASNQLARHHVIVKKLSAVETMGSVNMICTDKTGTLTTNQMTVISCTIGGHKFDVSGSGYQPEGDFNPSLHFLSQDSDGVFKEVVNRYDIFFYTAIFASNAHIQGPDEQHRDRYCMGDPTEGAIITMAKKAGYATSKLESLYPEIYEFPFDSNRKMMSSVRKIRDQYYLFVKGAVDQIIERSSQYRTVDGINSMTLDYQQEIKQENDRCAGYALRNIGLAYRILNPKEIEQMNQNHQSDYTHLQAETNLIYLGMVNMMDPPRTEVLPAMKYAHDAHIQVNMVTGDYGVTAQVIGHQVGLINNNQDYNIITGQELNTIDDNFILSTIQQGPVIFCRVSPQDKMRIVNILKQANYVVAVTGDGVNDAPALKKADIGIAMGITGTDVAKDSADMVITDDNFASIIHAISQGRIVFANIQKIIIGCLTTNFTELTIALGGLLMYHLYSWPLALPAILLLCIDLIGEMFPLSALSFDPADPEISHQYPRDIHKHILTKSVMIDLIVSGLVMGMLGYGTFVGRYRYQGVSIYGSDNSTIYASAISLTYVTIMLSQFANILVIRTGRQKSVRSSYLRSNPYLLIAFVISLICIMMIIYHPGIQQYLGTGPLDLLGRITALGSALLYMIYREMLRKYRIGSNI